MNRAFAVSGVLRVWFQREVDLWRAIFAFVLPAIALRCDATADPSHKILQTKEIYIEPS